MDDDRTLLEKAARAAGIEVAYMDELGVVPTGTREDGPRRGTWNPLVDDGDALRLAVKLGMQLDLRDPETHVFGAPSGRIDEYHAAGDALSATRRAIVRAAAAIAAREAGKESAG